MKYTLSNLSQQLIVMHINNVCAINLITYYYIYGLDFRVDIFLILSVRMFLILVHCDKDIPEK